MLPQKYLGDKFASRGNKFFQENTWDFVGGRGDQGLFTYVYMVVRADFLHTHKVPGRGIWARHFYGGKRPWNVDVRHACPHYFRGQLTELHTPCVAAVLRAKASSARDPSGYRLRNPRPRFPGCADCCIGVIQRVI